MKVNEGDEAVPAKGAEEVGARQGDDGGEAGVWVGRRREGAVDAGGGRRWRGGGDALAGLEARYEARYDRVNS